MLKEFATHAFKHLCLADAMMKKKISIEDFVIFNDIN